MSSEEQLASPIVTIRDLAVEFELKGRSVSALDGLDLTIQRGEFLVLVGPSGCGKTTLLRVLAGLERVTRGVVDLRAPHHAGHSGTRTAMVFQEHGIFPWMTVTGNIEFALRASGLARRAAREQAVTQACRVGLEHFLDAYPRQLSGGMRQRVSIARALSVDPDLLLMDEPFAALDEQTKLSLQEQLLGLWENSGKTVVYVTHSLDEALVLADRVVVMTGRPGLVRDVVDVSSAFPRPRKVAAVRAHPRYGELFGRIWESLGGAMAAGVSSA